MNEKTILFPEGIPGFEHLTAFELIKEQGPFCYLQSVEEPLICFTLIDPSQLPISYAPTIPETYFEKIGKGKDEAYVVYAVTTVREAISDCTVNLAGPIIIHTENKKGIQVVTENTEYQVRHRLEDLLKGRM